MGKFHDLTGQKFGRLTVIKRVENNKQNGLMWLCKCECGNICVITSNHLKNGHTKSCGCLQKEKTTKHGLYNTRIYRIHQSIKRRCYTPNNTRYKNYGGRGIRMCDEWLNEENGFINFYNWAIDNGYTDELTIDRIDVNGNYEPSNCRWASSKTQARNRRNNKMIKYKNKVKCLIEWCEELDLSYCTIQARLDRGWTPEKAFETPIEKQKKEFYNESELF